MPKEANPSSATQKALALYRQGMPVREILKIIDIRESTIYSALRREQAKTTGCCTKCGGPIDGGGRTLVQDVQSYLNPQQPPAVPYFIRDAS
jgi:hypothetical protein